MCVYVCECACASASASECACVRASVSACACVRVYYLLECFFSETCDIQVKQIQQKLYLHQTRLIIYPSYDSFS